MCEAVRWLIFTHIVWVCILCTLDSLMIKTVIWYFSTSRSFWARQPKWFYQCSGR